MCAETAHDVEHAAELSPVKILTSLAATKI
jgi:hypothetical protein